MSETTTAPAAPSILAPIAALTLPDGSALSGRAQRQLAFIEAFVIDSADTYQLAAEELQAIKSKANTLEQQRTSITGPLNQVLRAVNDLFRGPADMLARAESALKAKMLGYQREQERLAAEERAKAEALARAERERIEAEAAARQAEAEAQAKAAQEAQQQGDLQAAALAQAAAQRAQAEAAAAATTAQMVVAPVVSIPAAPKVAGVSTRNGFDFEVTDLAALVKHVAEHPEHANFLAANIVALRNHIKAIGPATCKVPGVKIVPTKTLASRAA